MKKILLSLLCIFAAVRFAAANDVAVMDIKVGKEKKTQRVVIEFYEDSAPATVANFKKLAKKNFYNGIAFHRVFPHILVQTGDPLSRKRNRAQVGTGGPGYTLPPEFHGKHIAGAVAMSRLPDKINPARRSSGSQFYICLKAMPNLDGQYTVFGRVIDGMELLDKISSLPADTNDNPIDRVVIKSLKLVPSEKVVAAESSKKAAKH